jgi:hypothetical protein
MPPFLLHQEKILQNLKRILPIILKRRGLLSNFFLINISAGMSIDGKQVLFPSEFLTKEVQVSFLKEFNLVLIQTKKRANNIIIVFPTQCCFDQNISMGLF